jgi:hypothetical protein
MRKKDINRLKTMNISTNLTKSAIIELLFRLIFMAKQNALMYTSVYQMG